MYARASANASRIAYHLERGGKGGGLEQIVKDKEINIYEERFTPLLI